MSLVFRTLKPSEIECRVAQCSEKGAMLLLYKNARVDQNLLDEVVGPMNWMRHHSRDNANCVVSIWDEDKSQWVEKEDTGKESYTEAEKGLASDSFKRACFNWGIGRELYSAPFIWIGADKCDVKERNGRWTTFDKFEVAEILYDEDRNINHLVIFNATSKKQVFEMSKPSAAKPGKVADEPTGTSEAAEFMGKLRLLMIQKGVSEGQITQRYGALDTMSVAVMKKCISALEKSEGKK